MRAARRDDTEAWRAFVRPCRRLQDSTNGTTAEEDYDESSSTTASLLARRQQLPVDEYELLVLQSDEAPFASLCQLLRFLQADCSTDDVHDDGSSSSNKKKNRLFWMSPQVFLLGEQATCELWLSDFGAETGYDARICVTVTDAVPNESKSSCGQQQQCQRCREDGKTRGADKVNEASVSSHKFYLWMQQLEDDDRQQRQPPPPHPSAALESMRPALDSLSSWLARWSLETIQFQSIRMTTGLPWLPLSPQILHDLIRSTSHLQLRLFRVDSQLSQILGSTTLRGTLTLDRVCVDDPQTFLHHLANGDGDASGPTKLVIRRPYNVWTDLWKMLANNRRLVAFELEDDYHHPLTSSLTSHSGLAGNNKPPQQLAGTIKSLHLNYFAFSADEWQRLWTILRDHPALTSIHLGQENVLPDEIDTELQERTIADHCRTRSRVVAQSLQANRLLQELHISPSDVDDLVWTSRIVPCMERNQYGPRFTALAADVDVDTMECRQCRRNGGHRQESGSGGSNRMGLFSKTLGALRDKPYLLFQFLDQNRSSLAEALSHHEL